MPQYQDNIHNKINSKSIALNTRTILLSVATLFLFSVLFFSSSIKAQIANIISEDGDGIVGITSLMNAAISGDVQAVKFFAKSGTLVVNQKNIGGATALHIASRSGNTQVAQTLIENGANVNAVDNEGWTPLMRASLSKNPELITILLKSGADAKKMNSVGETAIINSASSECLECLEQLFSGYNFIENLNIETLKNQIEQAIIIAGNKNNEPIQAILKSYLEEKVNKAYSLNNLNNNPTIVDNGVVVVGSLDNQNNPVYDTSYKFNNLTKREQNIDEKSVVKSGNSKTKYKFIVYENHSSVQASKGSFIIKPQENNNKINDRAGVIYKYKFLGQTKPYIPLIAGSKKSQKPEYQPAADVKTDNKKQPLQNNKTNIDPVINTANIGNDELLTIESQKTQKLDVTIDDDNKERFLQNSGANVDPIINAKSVRVGADTQTTAKYKFLGRTKSAIK